MALSKMAKRLIEDGDSRALRLYIELLEDAFDAAWALAEVQRGTMAMRGPTGLRLAKAITAFCDVTGVAK